jgi:hypothetical protein
LAGLFLSLRLREASRFTDVADRQASDAMRQDGRIRSQPSFLLAPAIAESCVCQADTSSIEFISVPFRKILLGSKVQRYRPYCEGDIRRNM